MFPLMMFPYDNNHDARKYTTTAGDGGWMLDDFKYRVSDGELLTAK